MRRAFLSISDSMFAFTFVVVVVVIVSHDGRMEIDRVPLYFLVMMSYK